VSIAVRGSSRHLSLVSCRSGREQQRGLTLPMETVVAYFYHPTLAALLERFWFCRVYGIRISSPSCEVDLVRNTTGTCYHIHRWSLSLLGHWGVPLKRGQIILGQSHPSAISVVFLL